ncbi:MAG: hypothetical protein K1X85_11485 [Ignavibacteria bacterium]|nr:hypothetical protein [Ignavibacteria bacterium]
MKSTNELHELIKALTPQEKRRFKLDASVQGGGKKYIALFDLISRQKVYDEAKLRQELKKRNFDESISFTKNYLYKMILRSIISSSAENSADIRLMEMYSRCRALYDRALFGRYFKAVEAGKKVSLMFERYGFALEFISMQRQLLKKEQTLQNSADKFFREEARILGILDSLNHLKRIIAGLVEFRRVKGICRDHADLGYADDVLRKIGELSPALSDSASARERKLFASYLVHVIKGEARKALRVAKERLSIVKSDPGIFRSSFPGTEDDSYFDLLESYLRISDIKGANEVMREYENRLNRSGTYKLNRQIYEFMIKLSNARNAERKLAAQLAEELLAFLEINKGKITVGTVNELLLRSSLLCFEAGDQGGALKIAERLLSPSMLKFVPVMEVPARMIEVLCHFDLGNHRLVRYKAMSALKSFSRKGMLFETERTVLNQLKKSDSGTGAKEIRSMLESLNSKLVKTGYDSTSASVPDYAKWIERRLHSIDSGENMCLI